MLLGMDMHHGFVVGKTKLEDQFRLAKEYGLDGVYYKSPIYLSPTLDVGELNHCAQLAKEAGIYMDFGVGRVNPYNTNETPEIWELTGGDYKKAMELQIVAGAQLGCKEFIGVTAGWKGKHTGMYVYDRFRTDVSWEDQLLATEKFLKSLAPVLRDTGTRINLETHEEITSKEILRLIEAVGEDVLGVAFDTANVVARSEDPVAVARRVAPYTYQMHAKDCILYFSDKGIVRQVRPAGTGIVDFPAIFAILKEHCPDLHVQIEDHKGLMHLNYYDKDWLALHPEIDIGEAMKLMEYARLSESRIQAGVLENPLTYEQPPYVEQREERLATGIQYLRKTIC